MKDSFFKWLDIVHNAIYRAVTKIAYIKITKKRCKNAPRLSKEEINSIRRYWKKHFGGRVPLWEYRWYKKVGRPVDPELIPDVIWHSRIEPFFTNLQLEKGFQDKNYFEIVVGKHNSPLCITHCINGQYLDSSYLPIKTSQLLSLFEKNKEYICKPSIETGGGRGIQFLRGTEFDVKKLRTLEREYNSNYIIQSIIKQSEFMSAFNKCSINSIRIVSFLYKNKVWILSSFLRIGGSGSKLDNVSSGGQFIQINCNNGSFGSAPYREDLNSHDLVKSELSDNLKGLIMNTIPNWDSIVRLVKKTHYKLAHFGIINWDVALDYQNTPIIIEYNIIDASTYFHQLNNGPIFGKLTSEVLETIRKKT